MELLSNASTHASTTDHSSQQFPAPPHQSVRTVFPYTAFRCSSSERLRPFPASFRGKLEQTVSSIEHGRGKLRIPCRPAFQLMPFAKVGPQSLFHMPFHSPQALGAITVVEIARPPRTYWLSVATTSGSEIGVRRRAVSWATRAVARWMDRRDGSTCG